MDSGAKRTLRHSDSAPKPQATLATAPQLATGTPHATLEAARQRALSKPIQPIQITPTRVRGVASTSTEQVATMHHGSIAPRSPFAPSPSRDTRMGLQRHAAFVPSGFTPALSQPAVVASVTREVPARRRGLSLTRRQASTRCGFPRSRRGHPRLGRRRGRRLRSLVARHTDTAVSSFSRLSGRRWERRPPAPHPLFPSTSPSLLSKANPVYCPTSPSSSPSSQLHRALRRRPLLILELRPGSPDGPCAALAAGAPSRLVSEEETSFAPTT